MTGKPNFIFLGAAERASIAHDIGTSVLKWNVLGLKSVLLVNFLPTDLSGWKWVFAFRPDSIAPKHKLQIKYPDGRELCWISLSLGTGDPAEPLTLEKDGSRELTLMLPPHGYALAAFPLPPTTAEIPGIYAVMLTADEGPEELIGQFEVVVIDPPPLTPERVAAIKADPAAAKAGRAEFSCKHCKTTIRFYTALEKNAKLEADGYLWYETVPDRFECSCGQTKFDLVSIRRNFYSILGRRFAAEANAQIEPLYHQSTIETVRLDLLKIIDQNPREEVLQQFFQSNPILFHQFPSEKIFFKPPILTFFFADFCIVTPQKELIFIEIERAGTRLLKKDGGEAAELRHAIDQITNWIHVVDEHRLAVLDSLGISRSDVSTIRGVVIAGRDKGADAEHLRRLKGVDRGRVSLLTYDDIAFGLLALARRIHSL